MYKNIVITGANSPYFESLLTLISSIHKDSLEIIDMILVYDFGLHTTEIEKLESLKNVEVIKITTESPTFDQISSIKIKCHFLKMYSLNNSINCSKNVLWLDAGVCALKSLKPVFDIIENDDIFLVGDSHLNSNFTHKNCVEIMGATKKEMSEFMICSGMFGFKSDGKFKQLITEGWYYTQVPGCIDGFENNHRHDQSILSILASRYNCFRQDIDMYGYWTDNTRNLQTAKEYGSVIFVHRRGYDNKTNLLYEN